MGSQPEARRSGSARRRVLAVLLLGAVIAAGVLIVRQRPSADRLVEEAHRAIQEQRFADAQRSAEQALQIDPESDSALLMAATATERLGEWREALEYYSRIGDQRGKPSAEARGRAGDVLLLELHDLSGAEREFRGVLKLDPDNKLAHDRLAYILGLATRDWEMIPHQIAMLRAGDVTRTRLYALSLGDRLPTDPEVIRRCAEAAPDDPLVLAGLAQIAVAEQRQSEGREMLERAVMIAPELTAIRVRLGRLYFDSGSEDELTSWHAALPATAEEHPLLWVIRGLYAGRTAQPEAAARCFWEALRRDPNQQLANYQLGQLLTVLQRGDEAAAFLDRAQQLESYVQAVHANAVGRDDEPRSARDCVQAAELADRLGLVWEAYAWRRLATESMGAGELFDHEAPREPLTARCSPSRNPARLIDLSDYPMPVWNSGTGAPESVAGSGGDEAASRVSFVDHARAAGAEFVYFDERDPRTAGKRIFDSIGGGVAVLDYDLDGWPDLYATQRCPWPPHSAPDAPLDALFRNERGRRFRESAASAGLVEPGYSQGATVGDFNGDGFPDLYVANIGANRFFVNNGDGTFSDVTAETATAGDDWSTSCVLVDLNGDALPDLYVVNYLTGSDVYERVCTAPDGEAAVCPPGAFPAAPDRLYLNRGDGGFDDISEVVRNDAGYGRGLGVVAADLEDSGRLSLFVANDQDPNFLWVNGAVAPGETPRLVDEALLRGVALSGEGRAQACMGIAAGDANGDGRLDLFVTNFTEEPNTLYVGLEEGLFADATRSAHLADPSLQMLGFGTQFIDGELDGRLDLIVANGHIDDRTRNGEQYRMPPQYFSNLGDGLFAEAAAGSLGPYFSGQYLGRGLARWDWNRDGLEDVAISHLDAPLALLTNTTADAGHFIAMRLRGTASERDAIGARVTVRSGDLTLVRQLTAGDGFHGSNERVLIFGLGDRGKVGELIIQWPSGLQQRLFELSADLGYLVVEGRDDPLISVPHVLAERPRPE